MVITNWIAKGGVGKTTLLANLGIYLSQIKNKKVLLIDLDSQNNLKDCFGYFKEDFQNSIVDVINGDFNLNNLDDLLLFFNNDLASNLVLVPSHLELISKTNLKANEQRNLIKFIIEMNKIYDFVLVDCSPNFNQLNSSILTISDINLSIVEFDILSLNSLKSTINIINKYQNVKKNLVAVNKLILSEKNIMLANEHINKILSVDAMKQKTIFLDSLLKKTSLLINNKEVNKYPFLYSYMNRKNSFKDTLLHLFNKIDYQIKN